MTAVHRPDRRQGAPAFYAVMGAFRTGLLGVLVSARLERSVTGHLTTMSALVPSRRLGSVYMERSS